VTNRMLFKIIGGSILVGIVVGFAIIGFLYTLGVKV
jgi:hypothetical protein